MREQVLSYARPLCDQAEVFEVIHETTPVSFEANRLKELQTKQTHGLALRLIRNGRVGLATTTDFRDLLSLVNRAVASAQFGAEARFQLPSRANTTSVAVFDPHVEALTAEAMIALGQEMIDRVHNYDPDILCSANLAKTIATVRIANSQGEDVSYVKSVHSVSLNGNLTVGTDILDIGEEASSCRADIDAERLVFDVVNKFDTSKRPAAVSTGQMPVIFTPKAVVDAFYLPLQLAFSGKTIVQGASPLGDKIGQSVFDSKISLYDDGTVAFAPRSCAVDDEGIPTQRTTLANQGRVEAFLYDLQTAAQAGARSTGNGFRTLQTLPSPAFTSLIFAEGDCLLPDMIADVKEGLLIDQIMGAWAGNLLQGELSGNIHLGFKIENGVVVGRVKDAMVSGNVYQALGSGLAALGSETTWVEGRAFVPPMYFKVLSIATKQG